MTVYYRRSWLDEKVSVSCYDPKMMIEYVPVSLPVVMPSIALPVKYNRDWCWLTIDPHSLNQKVTLTNTQERYS